jgi:hypothetical protein
VILLGMQIEGHSTSGKRIAYYIAAEILKERDQLDHLSIDVKIMLNGFNRNRLEVVDTIRLAARCFHVNGPPY